jgi:hypothetical protein
MDFYISIYTLNKLDNLLDTYKKKILKDFHTLNNLSMDYQTFENSILERKNHKPLIRNLKPDINKCNAYVWKLNYGKIQCSHNKSINSFCKKHYLSQNYGVINFC